MGDYFDWWWGGGSWYDLKQQEEMASLSASQARATSALRSKLREEAQRSQDLGTRLTRIEDAVVAMVELEDLRAVMENFSDAVATRRYARDVLARIPALGRVPGTQHPQEPPDVPGYWLHPAVRAVAARLDGDTATEAEAAAEARRRDPVRTAQLLAAVAILLGSTVADDDLATLWPTGRQVSPYQRSLWLAVAGGALGSGARDDLVTSLRTALVRPDGAAAAPETGERFVQVRLPASAASAGSGETLDELVRAGLAEQRGRPSAGGAADALGRLRARVEAALAGAAAGVSPETAPAVPAGVPDLLAQVVSAGAPDEEPLVARLVEIRQALAAIGASTSIAAPAALDEQSLDVLELIRADLAEAADLGARAVAVRVLAPEILAVADELAQQALAPVAESEHLRVPAGASVTVTVHGPEDQLWRSRIAERVSATAPDTRGAFVLAGLGALLGIVAVVLGVAAAPGWLALVAPAVGMTGYGVWQVRSARAAVAERTATTTAAAERAIAEKAQELQGRMLELQVRQGRVPDDRDAVHTALGAAGAAG